MAGSRTNYPVEQTNADDGRNSPERIPEQDVRIVEHTDKRKGQSAKTSHTAQARVTGRNSTHY